MISVLVVDDDFMVARVHRGFVEAVPGFQVVEVAHTGQAALAAVKTLDSDLVLLDIYLPDMNGLDLLPKLREVQPNLDAIVISASNEVETVRRALRGGIAHYLIKPFSGADLRESLEHYQRTYRRLDREDEAQQQDVDRVFGHRTGSAAGAGRLPKLLSPETAYLVEQALRDAGTDLSASECADVVGLARVSVRRYLEHFVSVGRADVRLQYGGVGRPERRYLWRV
jgi:response regulator of citrate/malate metabolism